MEDEAEGLHLTTAGRPIYALDFSEEVNWNYGASPARWIEKANSFATAWFQKFLVFPSVWCVAEAMSVAQHETLCGDAWPQEFNWGAVQLRSLTAEEHFVLADIVPDPKNVKDARAALTSAVSAGTIAAEPHGALHVDSSPGKGWYWVFFHKFADDVDGASYFIHVLCEQRPKCKLILDRSLGAWNAELFDLADQMYATHYYEGFRIPSKMYTAQDGTQKTGAQMNVLDYMNSLIAIAPGICTWLQSQAWTSHPTKPVFDLTTVVGVQSALTFLAGKLGEHSFDPLGVDNVLGKNTCAALAAFQKSQNLPTTSYIDAQTVAALRTMLDKVLAQ